MSDSFSKKANQNKRAKAKEDKAAKMRDRKLNNNKGKGLEDMLAYIDENGNLSSKPPKETTEFEIDASDMTVKEITPNAPKDTANTGIVSFYNSAKGFGFISVKGSSDRIFFHNRNLLQPVQENDHVTFEVERTARGNSAVDVKKVSRS
ncbi:cold shock CspA family protein [Chitinophaga skermanii]|uniref:Cold shock CspA family protein n=1 Tax=Chitinophaga skermanii TaxID=331697 RepID=A0A327QVD5_9BACT|nr:cold shock domain-containing protein [Chitinophaga skermanii]RAJ08340.1 cold shock CspA family protein [Chitinophaga skermanii]